MQVRLVTLIVVIIVIALAIGATIGYSLATGQTGNTRKFDDFPNKYRLPNRILHNFK
jgi:hypothetical protein